MKQPVIRFATIDDVESIMQFIDIYWKKGHILALNRELFLYEYQEGKRINFVVSEDTQGRLTAVLGFIKTARTMGGIWLALWKVASHVKVPMLGISLLDFLNKSSESNLLMSNGINTKARGIYRYLGYYTGHLNQYVMINKSIDDFKILKLKISMQSHTFDTSNDIKLQRVYENTLSFDFEANKKQIPHKDKAYFTKRYFHHPIYEYEVYDVFKGREVIALLVMREVQVGSAKALRMVDYMGDEQALSFVSQSLYDMLITHDYEYVDFMCFGFDEVALHNAGFMKVDPDSDTLVVPNYFSPFVQENIKIHFFADTIEINRLRMCKSDGDQDRPS